MQQPNICVSCDRSIDDAVDSSEHILLQALGGRKQVRGFICRSCNSRTGQDWDAELVKQLEHVSVMHGVDRQRSGDLPAVRVKKLNGEELLLHADGLMAPASPSYHVTDEEQGKRVSIVARSKEEAHRMVAGIARKHATVDASAVLATATMTTRPNEDVLQFKINIGGPKAGRSVVKTALAMAHAIGIRHQECSSILPYLRGDDVDPPYGLFCERDLVTGRASEHLIHCVVVTGNPRRRRLLAYVEYFGIARYVILLSDSYTGKPLREIYAIDPGSGEELQIDVDLDLSDEELKRAITGNGYTVDSYRQAVELAIPIFLQRSEQRARLNMISAAFQHAAETLGIKDGDVLDEGRVHDLSLLIARELVPYVLALQRRTQAQSVAEDVGGDSGISG